MTNEAYYGAEYCILMRQACEQLTALVEKWRASYVGETDVQPIVYCTHRIKSPESMMRKLAARGLPNTPEAAKRQVYDGVGFRIVCAFESDVFLIIQHLESCGIFTVEHKKDYLSYPKPNGYRSVHLCVRMNDSGVLAEIQVRTIAMDCWATLEHQLRYKKNVANDTLLKSELKRCADEIASVDLTMQTIRELLKEADSF